MRIRHHARIRAIWTRRTPILLLLVAILQVLDWRSTLLLVAKRGEANRFINELAQVIGFGVSLAIIKLTFLAILFAGFIYWRKHRGEYETEFTVCLGLLVAAYGLVVFNNFR